MTELRTCEDALKKCELNGQIIPVEEVDIELIKSLLDLSEGDREAGCKLMKGLDKNSVLWNNVLTAHYDALHKLVDAYLRFDNVTSLNHICLFAYLCKRHQDLELDWNFFEKVRTKRNGIQYYGQKISKEDWSLLETQMTLYISILKRAVEKRLKDIP